MRTTALHYIAALLVFSPLARSARPHDEIAFSCVPLTAQLSDPIVFPGKQSDHTHLVAGGTAFQRTMAEDTARNAEGTTCGVEIDKSNYWVPHMYHRMLNGSFELVENAGISLYYMNRVCNYTEHAADCDATKHVPLAPPSGLRMVAGDPFLRTYNGSNKEQQAMSHMCIRQDGSSAETKHIPREPCSKMRSQVFFPSCWDGKNLDTPDHKSHMAYPAIGDYNKGICPASHPVATISIFIEFIFNTEPFPDHKNLVYAMGDTTGYGLHGDFIHGWTDQNALQDALSTCTGEQGLESPECSITRNQKKGLAPANAPLEVECPNDDVGQNGPVPELPGKKPVTGPSATGGPKSPTPPDFPTGAMPTTEPKPPTVQGFPTNPVPTTPTELQPTTEPGTMSKPEATMDPKPTTATRPSTEPEPPVGAPGEPDPWWGGFDDGF